MSWFLTAVKYFPFIMQAVIAVQSAMAGAPGAAKKSVVMAAVQSVASVGESIPDAHVAGISKMVDDVVGSLTATNFAGFGTSAVAPAASTAK